MPKGINLSGEMRTERFVRNSINLTIRNLIDNPTKRKECIEKLKRTFKERGVSQGKNNSMYGKHHSKETKEKLRKIFWKEDSPHCNYYHRLSRAIVEKKICRKILPNEVVHHLDHDRSNNHLDNLHIFNSQSKHIKYHRMKEGWLVKEWGVKHFLGRKKTEAIA